MFSDIRNLGNRVKRKNNLSEDRGCITRLYQNIVEAKTIQTVLAMNMKLYS